MTINDHLKQCPFCAMAQGRPVFDIEPLNPVTPGHRLIIPGVGLAHV